MRKLYLNLLALPSVLLFLLACEQAKPPAQNQQAQEPWPHEAEVIFQNAEVVKHSVQQHQLETERLEHLAVPPTAPISQ